MREYIKEIIAAIAILVLGVFGGAVGKTVLTVETNDEGETVVKIESESQIELSTETVPTKIETADGVIEVIDAPTVESVDTGNIVKECPEGEECGQGRYIYAPTETPQEFKDYTLGGCWNTDNYFNEQCWDLGDLFWQNYAGRNLSTCKTGAAKGIWDCKEQNAGEDFVLITDATQLQPGDWVIFNNGTYGHIGMAIGYYNNGYIALLGQNQGGGLCDGSTMGAKTNIVNISLKSFAGAFRPKSYIKPEPQPEPTPEPTPSTASYTVVKGDTLGGIARKLGWCNGCVLFGDNGYAQKMAERSGIPNRGLIYPGQVVYKP